MIGPIRPPMRGSCDPLLLVKGRSMVRYRTAKVRGEGTRLQRASDHMRGGIFGAAAIMALVAAFVFTRGGGTI